MNVTGALCVGRLGRVSDPTLAPCCPRTADGVDTWTDAYDVGDMDDDVDDDADRRLRQWTTTRTVDAYGSRL